MNTNQTLGSTIFALLLCVILIFIAFQCNNSRSKHPPFPPNAINIIDKGNGYWEYNLEGQRFQMYFSPSIRGADTVTIVKLEEKTNR